MYRCQKIQEFTAIGQCNGLFTQLFGFVGIRFQYLIGKSIQRNCECGTNFVVEKQIYWFTYGPLLINIYFFYWINFCRLNYLFVFAHNNRFLKKVISRFVVSICVINKSYGVKKYQHFNEIGHFLNIIFQSSTKQLLWFGFDPSEFDGTPWVLSATHLRLPIENHRFHRQIDYPCPIRDQPQFLEILFEL